VSILPSKKNMVAAMIQATEFERAQIIDPREAKLRDVIIRFLHPSRSPGSAENEERCPQADEQDRREEFDRPRILP
jgi:hypothetical protein